MKRYHKRFLALCLSASMLVSPLSYTRAYASEETSITENSSQNETVAESENKSESQSPAAEEAGKASSQEKENASNNNSNTADAEKSGIGSFHVHLFDVLEEKLMYTSKHKF